MRVCEACGEESPDRARFCLGCGAALEAPAPAREVRKTVTVVFADVTGSTALGEELDPETLRAVMSRYFDAMRAAIERHGGTVEKFIGDAVMAVFGIPVVHEDDAVRAVRAAAEIRDVLAGLNAELRRERDVEIAFRTGVNTGEVVAGDASRGQGFATGDAVNVAARLEAAAAPGEILLGETTYRLVRDAVEAEPLPPLQVKGKAEPLAAFRLVSVKPGAPGRARRPDSPLVGRDRERRLLFGAFERTLAERACHLVTVLGTPGVGKSRLAAEFLDGLGTQARVIRGRCLSYGEGITYWPLAEALADAAGIEERDDGDALRAGLRALAGDDADAELVVQRLAGVLGASDAVGDAEETAWAARRLFEAMARREPLVVVLDDIHWAEPALLDLVAHVAGWSRDAPILLLCLARPELLEARRGWGGDTFNATSVLLEPLADAESKLLIENLLGHARLPDALVRRVVDAAEGNPLFVEELVGMLIDEGALREGEDGWAPTRDLAGIPVPPTIHALLAARLDGLGPEERAVLEAASVEGKVFHRSALAALAGDALRPQLASALLALVRRDLIRPDQARFAGDDAFRFRHQLIRDAAYDALPKAARADLHAGFADWLEAQHSVEDLDEIVGYHLEQAARYRRELSPGDPEAAGLASRAADLIAAAGRRAHLRGDPAALGLLERAYALLPPGDPRRYELAIKIADALVSDHARFEGATAILEDERRSAAGRGETHAVLRVDLEMLSYRWRTDPGYALSDQADAIRDAARAFEEAGDLRGLATAYRQLSEVHLGLCEWAASATASERALAAARAVDDPSHVAQLLLQLANALFWGSVPAHAAEERTRAILDEARALGSGRLEAHVLSYLSGLAAYGGRFAEARELAADSRRLFLERGDERGLRSKDGLMVCEIEELAGDTAAAERYLREACGWLEEREAGVFSTVAGNLALNLARSGQAEEALVWAAKSEAATAADDIASQVIFRASRALAQAHRGEHEAAEQSAREALRYAEASDFLNLHADVLLTLAQARVLAGRPEAARDAAVEAARRFEAKGNVVAARAARELADAQSAGVTPSP